MRFKVNRSFDGIGTVMCAAALGGFVAIGLEKFAHDDGGIVLAYLAGLVVFVIGLVVGFRRKRG